MKTRSHSILRSLTETIDFTYLHLIDKKRAHTYPDKSVTATVE